MRLLLDTHVFLWFISGSPQLPTTLRLALRPLRTTTSGGWIGELPVLVVGESSGAVVGDALG